MTLSIPLRSATWEDSAGCPIRVRCRCRPGTVKLVPRTPRADGFRLVAFFLAAAAGKTARSYANNGLCTLSSDGWHCGVMAMACRNKNGGREK